MGDKGGKGMASQRGKRRERGEEESSLSRATSKDQTDEGEVV